MGLLVNDPVSLQTYLKATGRYAGAIDGSNPGWCGKLTQGAILLALTDGPHTQLTDQDIRSSSNRMGVPFANIKAFTVVEASGSGFQDGRPKILPEPHIFSALTGHRFDRSNPDASYSNWGQRPYPPTQDARYDLLLKMVGLDVPAGFSAVSYGKFQILGENFQECGYNSSFSFAEAQSRDEQTQLSSFESFVYHKTGLLDAIRKMGKTAESCEDAASLYNGTGYRRYNYHGKLAAAVAQFS